MKIPQMNILRELLATPFACSAAASLQLDPAIARMKQALLSLDYTGLGLCRRTSRFSVCAVVPRHYDMRRVQAWCKYHGLPVRVCLTTEYVLDAHPPKVLVTYSKSIPNFTRSLHPLTRIIEV